MLLHALYKAYTFFISPYFLAYKADVKALEDVQSPLSAKKKNISLYDGKNKYILLYSSILPMITWQGLFLSSSH